VPTAPAVAAALHELDGDWRTAASNHPSAPTILAERARSDAAILRVQAAWTNSATSGVITHRVRRIA